MPQCCKAWPWTSLSSYKIGGTKNNPVCVQLEQIWDQKIQKRQKEKKKMSFLKSQEPNLGVPSQSRYCARPGCTHHHQRGGQDHLSAPPLPQHTPTLPSPHIRNKLAPTLGSRQARGLVCSWFPPAATGAPIKPCLKKKNSKH